MKRGTEEKTFREDNLLTLRSEKNGRTRERKGTNEAGERCRGRCNAENHKLGFSHESQWTGKSVNSQGHKKKARGVGAQKSYQYLSLIHEGKRGKEN